MQDKEILWRIKELVDEEHALRERRAAGQLDSEEEHERIQWIEDALDHCWDLLRQRRARRAAGEDPDYGAPRPADEIEDYPWVAPNPPPE